VDRGAHPRSSQEGLVGEGATATFHVKHPPSHTGAAQRSPSPPMYAADPFGAPGGVGEAGGLTSHHAVASF
jgi:hypothetical protein